MDKMTYKLIQVSKNEQLHYFQKELADMIQALIDKTKSKVTIERVFDLIISNLANPYFRLYIVIDNEFKATAYFIIQLGYNDDTGEMQAYIYHHMSKVGMIPEINKQMEALLLVQGAKTAKFITKRNEDAFGKSLGDEWEKTGTVFEKQLKEN